MEAIVTLKQFEATLDRESMPQDMTPALRALWMEANGDWDGAHRLIQHLPGLDNAWVHAYLHRKEGDLGNASYWYRRAAKQVFDGAYQEEWRSIADALLKN